MTLYRKVFTKDRLPKKQRLGVGVYSTDRGLSFSFDVPECEWWLEEIEMPTDEEISNEAYINSNDLKAYTDGANYILNKLKG